MPPTATKTFFKKDKAMKEFEEVVDDSELHFTDGGEDTGAAVADPVEDPEDANGNQKDPAAGRDPAEPKEEMVPLSALKSERMIRQNAEQNLQIMNDTIKAFRATDNDGTSPKDMGDVTDDTVITGRELRDIVGKIENKFEQQLSAIGAQNSTETALLQVKAQYPDYDDVINTNLINVLEAQPQMKQALSEASERFRPLLAYNIATLDPAYVKRTTTNKVRNKIQKNAKTPASVNATGGAADDTDLARVIANESQADFNKRVEAVKRKAAQ